MSFKKNLPSKNNLIILSTAILFASGLVLFQNCSPVQLKGIQVESLSLSCDPSIYDISRQNELINNQSVYFLKAHNYDISNEYSGQIEWVVNGEDQPDNVIHNNRLYLDCSHYPDVQNFIIQARFLNDCGDVLEIEEAFSRVRACEEVPVNEPPTPGPGGTLENVISITAGANHTCVVLEGGYTKCWGDNSSGQFGNGSTESSTTPVGFYQSIGAQKIFNGFQHTCALLETGGVKCWGRNYEGQAKGPDKKNVLSPPATEIPGLSGAQKLSLSEETSCALLDTGFIKCWGGPGLKGSFATPIYSGGREPIFLNTTHVKNIKDFSMEAVATNYFLSIINKNSNYVDIYHNSYSTLPASCRVEVSNPEEIFKGFYVKGDNGIQQIYKLSPTQCALRSIPGLPQSALKVVSGANHSCALLADKSVGCWGDNTFGLLGNSGVSGNSPSMVKVPDLSQVIDIVAGERHTCVLLQNQRVKCWGYNMEGQLGTGDTHNRATPTEVVAETENPTPSPYGDDYCAQYKASMTPEQLADFNAYNAENRDFRRKELPYNSLQMNSGSPAEFGYPTAGTVFINMHPKVGFQIDEYYAFSFEMPEPGTTSSNSGLISESKYHLYFKPEAFMGWGELIATVSPCPGDFRPPDKSLAYQNSDPYLGMFCRFSGFMENNRYEDLYLSNKSSTHCKIPVNKKLYMNVVNRDVYKTNTSGAPLSRTQLDTVNGLPACMTPPMSDKNINGNCHEPDCLKFCGGRGDVMRDPYGT